MAPRGDRDLLVWQADKSQMGLTSVGTCGFLRKEGSALCPLPLAGVWDLRAEGGLGPLIESRVERVNGVCGERGPYSPPPNPAQ